MLGKLRISQCYSTKQFTRLWLEQIFPSNSPTADVTTFSPVTNSKPFREAWIWVSIKLISVTACPGRPWWAPSFAMSSPVRRRPQTMPLAMMTMLKGMPGFYNMAVPGAPLLNFMAKGKTKTYRRRRLLSPANVRRLISVMLLKLRCLKADEQITKKEKKYNALT